MKIPLLGSGVKSKSVNVSAQARQNLYLDIVPGGGDKATVVAYGTPGLVLSQDLGAERTRGVYWFQAINRLFLVNRDQLIEIDASGVQTVRGTLSSTDGPVSMADNGAQLLVVDGTDTGYIYTPNATASATISSLTHSTTTATLTTATPHGLQTGTRITVTGATPTAYNGEFVITVTAADECTYTMLSDPGANASPVGSYTYSAFQTIDNFPGAISASFLAGYFLVNKPKTGQFYVSAFYNGLSWAALDYATAESTPDNLARVIAHNGTLILLGEISTEFWAPSGGALFAFAPIANAVESWGVAAPWSVAICGELVIFLGQNRRGGVSVVALNGYSAAPISPPDLDVEIAGYVASSDATAFSYRMQGHDFYQISFRTAGKSWLYDATSGTWSMLKGYGLTRHRAEWGATFGRDIVVTDYETGLLYTFDADTYTDNGDPIERRLVSPHLFDGASHNFVMIPRFRVDMETGVGLASGQGSTPRLMLRVSQDNGHSWHDMEWADIGAIGETLAAVEWRRLGRARDWLFELVLTDPVKPVFIGAYVELNVANK